MDITPQLHSSFIKPETSESRTPIAKVSPQVQLTNVAQVRLPDAKTGVKGHPHAQHLVVLALDNFFGERLLFGMIRGLPQPGGEIIDDGVIEAEIVLRR